MGKKKVGHDCSSKVKHEEYGVGDCIKEMHTLDENGNITHYDVLFSDRLVKNVSVENLEVLVREYHEHYINVEKNQEVVSEKKKGLDGKACWKGYSQRGTKKKGGKTVDNCVKNEEVKKNSKASIEIMPDIEDGGRDKKNKKSNKKYLLKAIKSQKDDKPVKKTY